MDDGTLSRLRLIILENCSLTQLETCLCPIQDKAKGRMAQVLVPVHMEFQPPGHVNSPAPHTTHAKTVINMGPHICATSPEYLRKPLLL